MNELLLRLTARNDPHQQLFALYRRTLNRLGHGERQEQSLRLFEKAFLQLLGYGLVLDREVNTGAPINQETEYCYVMESGPLVHDRDRACAPVVRGKTLIDLSQGDLSDPRSLREARRLMRAVIAQYLGGKPLKSRDLFMAAGDLR